MEDNKLKRENFVGFFGNPVSLEAVQRTEPQQYDATWKMFTTTLKVAMKSISLISRSENATKVSISEMQGL